MPLYSYKKKVKFKSTEELQNSTIDNSNIAHPETIVVKDKSKNRLTIGELLSGIKNDIVKLVIDSKVAGLVLPVGLILFGISTISKQVWPEIEQKIKLAQGAYKTETIALVEGEYIERNKYLSNPGTEYFKNINDQASQKHILQPDPKSNNYHSKFRISIPSIELMNLPVQANVDSSTEESYQNALKSSLAHFKGTGLPISDVNNNIVIYGHSSSGDYYERTRDIAGAFSRLNKIKVGDIVTLNIDNTDYKFRITKTKIVEPDETEIITGITNKRTLTLFTCFPNGNNAQRFVAIGNPI